jgi:uncharacterized membrane protein YjgN (DUF898 family)
MEEASNSATTPEPAQQARQARLEFTGRGAEYFRLWVVNVLLTLLSLGLYSAWAKVRKARWFVRHTRLMGDAFDYHGRPGPILRGRLLVLPLLLAYGYAFLWSTTAGLLAFGLLYAAGPLLFAQAQRFKLGNTSWRGLRFGFDAPRAQVYQVCLPLILLWTATTLVLELHLGEELMWGSMALTALGLPWAHGRLKQLQHSHARYGAQRFSYAPGHSAFYGVYFAAAGMLVLAMLAGGCSIWLIKQWGSQDEVQARIMVILAGIWMLILAWLFAWPVFAAKVQQIVWRRSDLGDVAFDCDLRPARFWWLAFRQILLVLLTAGLYWPFAAVALARYRIESISLHSPVPLDRLVFQAAPAATDGALGEGSADGFGLDLGW